MKRLMIDIPRRFGVGPPQWENSSEGLATPFPPHRRIAPPPSADSPASRSNARNLDQTSRRIRKEIEILFVEFVRLGW